MASEAIVVNNIVENKTALEKGEDKRQKI